MMLWRSLVVFGALNIGSIAWAQELRVGVLLPQAPLGSNAERSVWAERLGQQLSQGSAKALEVRTQVFARASDAQTFSSSLDILLTDGLSFSELKQGEVIAHARPGKVGLYAAKATSLEALKGAKLGLIEPSPSTERYWANAVFGGELTLDYFGERRAFKDLASAVSALKTGEVAVILAPETSETAALVSLVQGGPYLGGVWVALSARAKKDKSELTQAITGLPAGALGAFQAGPGETLKGLPLLLRVPAVTDAPAVLTPWDMKGYPRPTLRVEGDNALSRPRVEAKPPAPPSLPEIF